MKTHLELAKENFRSALAMHADETPSREWRITFLFYAALHAVNHAIDPNGLTQERNSHDNRELDMQRDKRLAPKISTYKQLKNLATEARYKPAKHPMPDEKLQTAKSYAHQIFKAAGIEPPGAPSPVTPSASSPAAPPPPPGPPGAPGAPGPGAALGGAPGAPR